MWFIFLMLLVVWEGVADVLSKEWSLRGRILLGSGALACYIVANVFWLFALRSGSGLVRGGIIFSVASALLATSIGILWYHEILTKTEMAGVLVGILSLVLIFWPS